MEWTIKCEQQAIEIATMMTTTATTTTSTTAMTTNKKNCRQNVLIDFRNDFFFLSFVLLFFLFLITHLAKEKRWCEFKCIEIHERVSLFIDFFLCRSTIRFGTWKTVSNFQLKCVVIANGATTHKRKIKKNIQLICDGVHIRLYISIVVVIVIVFSIRLRSFIWLAVCCFIPREEEKKVNSFLCNNRISLTANM